MRLFATTLAAAWASFYTGTVAFALWKARNRRGAIIGAVLAGIVLAFPIVAEFILRNQR